MKTRLLICLGVVAFSNVAIAYHFNGLYHKTDDGTYSIELHTSKAHYYIGYAEENADGTLDVSVQDLHGEAYSGTAMEGGHDTYDLNLQNTATGQDLKGTMYAN